MENSAQNKKLVLTSSISRENKGSLLNEMADLFTHSNEKTKILIAFFPQTLSRRQDSWKVSDSRLKGWIREDVPLAEQDKVREYFSKLGIHKSMGPDAMHPQVLKKLADAVKTLSNLGSIMASGRSTQRLDENKCPSNLQRGQEVGLGNCKPVSLTLTFGQVMEQLILETIQLEASHNGVFQGSVLTPVLFYIFSNDVNKDINLQLL